MWSSTHAHGYRLYGSKTVWQHMHYTFCVCTLRVCNDAFNFYGSMHNPSKLLLQVLLWRV